MVRLSWLRLSVLPRVETIPRLFRVVAVSAIAWAVSGALAPSAALAQPGAGGPYVGTAPAQPPQPIRLGVVAGLNLATFATDNSDLPPEFLSNKLGAAFGGALSYRLNEILTLHGELLYSMKGSGFDLSGFGGPDATVSLDYLQLPLLFEARLPTGGALTPFVHLGTSTSFLLRAETDVEGTSEDIREETNDIDLGLVIGGGLEIDTPQGAFLVIARYEFGLSNVPDEDDNGGDEQLTNRVFTLGVGMLF